MQADDDEVVREIDVYFNHNEQWQLIQFPLIPIYFDPVTVQDAKYKPIHKKMEFLGKKSAAYDDFHFSSSRVAQDTSMAAGIICDDAMYLAPIDTALQMRSSVKNLHKAKGEYQEEEEEEEKDENSETETNADGLQQVTLKRKESERAQASREQSYAYLSKKEDMEPWQHLKVNAIGSAESDNILAHLHSRS